MRDVGVVMPVYEQKSAYLKAAIRSMLAQKYKHFKMVIVIDGASSKVKRIIQREVKGDRRVRIIEKSSNEGVAKALNRGFRSLLRRKDIRYLTWVSSDNVYYPNFLSTLRRAIRKSSSKTGLIYSSFRHVDESGQQIQSNPLLLEFRKWQRQPKENLLDVCFIGVSFMYKRRFAEKVGDYQLEPVEDYDYWLRLTDYCDIQYVKRVLMDYRVNSAHSVSRVLGNSQAQHRRWRYAYQLTKLNARNRRGIPPETTVVIPMMNGDDASISRLEGLFEQYYANCRFLVIDASPDQQVAAKISLIPDPRVEVQSAAGVSEATASQMGAIQATTPFTMVYSTGLSLSTYDLHNLAVQLRQAPSEVSAVYVVEGSVKCQSIGEETGNTFPHLYRTEMLRARMSAQGW